MFVSQAKRNPEEPRKHEPEMYASTKSAPEATRTGFDFVCIDKTTLTTSPDNPIDYTVMGKTTCAAVVPVSCDWSDVGSWGALWTQSNRDADGNWLEGGVIAIDSGNRFVRSTEQCTVAALMWETP